ncbi:HNH endonuclease signature motif containing protein [Rossellomorea marisflavi]|uniref:HNH endonuclease n=1 Tax=Rossellomorea marisflavi TaxID=189381 RepID=UPI0034592F0E
MDRSKLKKLLSRNDKCIEDLLGKMYENMLLSVFETICLEMKDNSVRKAVLSNIRKASHPELYVQRLAFEMSCCDLSNDECNKLLGWLVAYFRKSGIRKKYPKSVRDGLLIQQDFKCNICGKDIGTNKSELDHIIPWDYVGDEIADNLQLLCCNCNERKGKSIYFQLNMYLINHKRAQ